MGKESDRMPAPESTPDAENVWNLADLYASPQDPTVSSEMEKSLRAARDFQSDYQGKEIVSLDPPDFLRALKRYEAILEEGLKPFLYGSLLFSEDTQNTEYKSLLQKGKEAWNQLENALLFFRLALTCLPDSRLKDFGDYPPLRDYRHALEFHRRFQPFTLKEKEEEIVNRKNLTGRSAFTNLFDEFTGSFVFHLKIGEEEKELTGSEVLALLHSPDRELRERAFRTFLQHHGQNSLVLAALFNALILDHRVEDELRGYKEPMQRTHLENEIRPEAVELMMGATETYYPLAQEYFQIKACLLGLPKLKNCDIYAPLPGGHRVLPLAEAKDLLLRSFGRFHPLFGRIAAEFFEKQWVDAKIRKGKYGGAFCSGLTPSLHPYLLLNYTGNLRDALTLAHEMGHGIHFYLARKQTLLNFDPPLTLAETASVFGEMIMAQALLRDEGDLEVRQALLCAEIEDIIATVFRQNVLTRFEQAVYDLRRDHLLSGKEIGDLWWRENEKLFGKAVEMVPEYRWGWSYISHFIHSRFYCYSYIFGELVVLALYEKYLEEGETFIPGFVRLLESGGSASPDVLLARLGLDVNRADLWERGFKVIRNLIDELKSLGPWEKICVRENP
jgi:oligoendopeptidase F